MELDISNWGKSRSSNSIFGGLEKYSAERWGVRDHVMRGMLMQTDQRARTKVLLFMKPFYLNCQLSCKPGISIVCCFLTGPFQTHNCFKRKLTSAWFFFNCSPRSQFFKTTPYLMIACTRDYMVLLGISVRFVSKYSLFRLPNQRTLGSLLSDLFY